MFDERIKPSEVLRTTTIKPVTDTTDWSEQDSNGNTIAACAVSALVLEYFPQVNMDSSLVMFKNRYIGSVYNLLINGEILPDTEIIMNVSHIFVKAVGDGEDGFKAAADYLESVGH